jgi:hypothetical protein
LTPIGDRLPYDLVLDIDSKFYKIQVKSAWFDESCQNYFVDNRRTKTNRRVMLREKYRESDFDFAIIYLEDIHIFYVMPIEIFIGYSSGICLVESEKRQRKPKSADYREAWHLMNSDIQ